MKRLLGSRLWLTLMATLFLAISGGVAYITTHVPTVDTRGWDRNVVLDGGEKVRYSAWLDFDSPSLIVDLPEGHTYWVQAYLGDPEPGHPDRIISVVLLEEDENDRPATSRGQEALLRRLKALVSFDARRGEEVTRFITGEGWTSTWRGEKPSSNPLHEVLDKIAESAYIK